MPWGVYVYDWADLDRRPDWQEKKLREYKRAGITHCAVSPLVISNQPAFNAECVPDFSYYDRCIQLYKRVGFHDPIILAMENLLFSVAVCRGKAGELKFTGKDGEIGERVLGVGVDEIPEDVRDLLRRTLRRLDALHLEQRGCQRRNFGCGQLQRKRPPRKQHAETSVPIGEFSVPRCVGRNGFSHASLCVSTLH